MNRPATNRSNQDDIWSALNAIPADDRETWIKIGMAIKSGLGAEGFSFWDDWSQSAGNYSERAARDVWRSIKDGNVRIGTLFHLAKENGWNACKTHQIPKPAAKVAPSVCTSQNPQLFAAVARQTENHPIVTATYNAADFAPWAMQTQA